MDNDVKITTPASPEYLYLMRFVLSGVLATAEYGVDRIEDLKPVGELLGE